VNSEPFETPASRAMTAVGALSPCAAMTRVAAASSASLLSSLFGLAIGGVYK
jgi:hypothetical protein